MRFNVGHLLRQAVGSQFTWDVDEKGVRLEEGDRLVEVAGTVTFLRTKQGILVSADLRTAFRLRCSRCLADMEQPLAISFREEFLPTADAITGQALAIPEEDAQEFLIDSHQWLDITEAVRQYCVMEEPIKPLCRPDCRGLCPQCGADLNRGACACSSSPAELPWQGLAELAAELSEEGS